MNDEGSSKLNFFFFHPQPRKYLEGNTVTAIYLLRLRTKTILILLLLRHNNIRPIYFSAFVCKQFKYNGRACKDWRRPWLSIWSTLYSFKTFFSHHSTQLGCGGVAVNCGSLICNYIANVIKISNVIISIPVPSQHKDLYSTAAIDGRINFLRWEWWELWWPLIHSSSKSTLSLLCFANE